MSAIRQANVEVGQSPTSLTEIDGPFNAFDGGKVSFAFYNGSTIITYIGGEDVTTSNGIPLPAGACITLEAPFGVNVYGITDTENSSIRVLQIG